VLNQDKTTSLVIKPKGSSIFAGLNLCWFEPGLKSRSQKSKTWKTWFKPVMNLRKVFDEPIGLKLSLWGLNLFLAKLGKLNYVFRWFEGVAVKKVKPGKPGLNLV